LLKAKTAAICSSLKIERLRLKQSRSRLSVLSAFLGHAHWTDTFWYLTATPALMRDATRRLDRHWKKRT
jgi:hypothetical protein